MQHTPFNAEKCLEVQIRNLMLPPCADGRLREGGYTLLDGQPTTVFAAATSYLERGIPSIVVAGEEYGTGSSRDWAAKGTRLLGVRAVIARSYERIHRANLVGMGVLPLQFIGNESAASLGLRGDERFDITGLAGGLSPMQTVGLLITRADGERRECALLCRIDTPIEVSYYRAGGILPFVLGQLLAGP